MKNLGAVPLISCATICEKIISMTVAIESGGFPLPRLAASVVCMRLDILLGFGRVLPSLAFRNVRKPSAMLKLV